MKHYWPLLITIIKHKIAAWLAESKTPVEQLRVELSRHKQGHIPIRVYVQYGCFQKYGTAKNPWYITTNG